MKVLIAGMVSLGAVTGILISFSNTPVIATLLPLLFSIIGITISFIVGRMDLENPKNILKLNFIGLCISSICVSCFSFMIIGLISRNYLERSTSSASAIDVSQAENVRAAIVLRAQLRALGASPAEIKAVVSKPPTMSESDMKEAINTLLSADKTSQKPNEIKWFAYRPGLGPIFEDRTAASPQQDQDRGM